jgi:FkbM family methyltransferase
VTPAVFPPAVETELVRAFFADKPRGYFVDVGANEPYKDSQSWHLEQAGWAGILVEPQPGLADALRAARTARVFQAACSSPRNANTTMLLHVAGPHSSLDPQLIAGAQRQGTIEVPVRTLDSLLAEANAPAPLDLLSVDVEGHEIEVLSGFDFARWQPRLILLEDHVGNLRKHRFMGAAGYHLIRRTGLNAWYVPKDHAGRLGWLGRWQLLRKYYLALPFRIIRDAKRRLFETSNARIGV